MYCSRISHLNHGKGKFSINSRNFSSAPINEEKVAKNYVKQADYYNYFVGLTYPPKSRRAFYAIRAFNIEIAKINEMVSSSEMGALKIEWWKDLINQIYKGQNQVHPIAKELAFAVKEFKLTKAWFNKILDRRKEEISHNLFHQPSEMETYCEETYSSLLYLSLECLGVKNLEADHVASHLGKTIGITVFLRATPFHASKKRCYLPLNLMAKYGAKEEDLYRKNPTKEISDVVFETASIAKSHLDHSREISKGVPKQAVKAFLPAVFADDYLTKLQKLNFNIFDPRLQGNHISFSAYWAFIKKYFTKSY